MQGNTTQGFVTVKGRKRYRTARLRRPSRTKLTLGYRTYANELRASRQFTERDYEILKMIYATGLMSRHQLQRIFWPDDLSSSVVVSARLRTLYQRWVLNITTDASFEMEQEGLMACHIYALGPVGEEILALDQHQKRSELGYNQRYAAGRSRQNIMHDLMASEVLTQAITYAYTHEKALLTQAQQLFGTAERAAKKRHILQNRLTVSWGSEQHSSIWQGDKELVRPDGVLSLEQAGERKLFFVELDRGHTRWPKKIHLYDNAKQFGRWQAQFQLSTYPTVLVIAPNRRSQRICQQIATLRPQTNYLIKEWADYLADPMHNWMIVAGANTAVSLITDKKARLHKNPV